MVALPQARVSLLSETSWALRLATALSKLRSMKWTIVQTSSIREKLIPVRSLNIKILQPADTINTRYKPTE
jgi:hypothetical protein